MKISSIASSGSVPYIIPIAENLGSGDSVPSFGPAYTVEFSNRFNNETADKELPIPMIAPKKSNVTENCLACNARKFHGVSNQTLATASPIKPIGFNQTSTPIDPTADNYRVEDEVKTTKGTELVRKSIRIYSAVCPVCGYGYIDSQLDSDSVLGKNVDIAA